MTERALAHLSEAYPALRPLLMRVGPLEQLLPSPMAVPEAVVRVVVGQMLSRSAADSIYKRVCEAASRRSSAGSWELPPRTLRRLGLSASKARTIAQFASEYRRNAGAVDRWKLMDAESVRQEVTAFWGMSDWSASMLSIFYFGHEDVFPASDGTLLRALVMLQAKGYLDKSPSVQLGGPEASPYRSYLALYLWRLIDDGIL